MTAAARVSVRLLVGVIVAAVFFSGAPSATAEEPVSATAPPVGDREALIAKARVHGSVRVVAGLRTSFRPEGELGNGARVAQRARIDEERAELLDALHGARHRTVREYESIPYVALDLSPEAVEDLWASGTALTVTEDRRVRPTATDGVGIVQAPEVWTAGYDGASQVVAVLDTGVDKTHPALTGRVVDEACYSFNDGCPNGSSSQVGPGAGVPCTFHGDCDHGTHVAGIAAGHQGTTFSGVAPAAGVMAVQVFSDYDGLVAMSSDIIAGLQRVYDRRTTFSIAAVNLSLGGGSYGSFCDAEDPAMAAVIANLRSAGIATVVASGNDGYTTTISYPACMSGAVSVGSTTAGDEVSWFSNAASFLSLLAPGSSISSSVTGGGYAVKSGTSMATPHVAGAWALLRQAAPSATVSSLLAQLQSTGEPVFDPGNGLTFERIRVFDAMTALTAVPGAPTGVSASAGNGSATVTWSPPSSSGGSALTSYVVTAAPGSASVTVAPTVTSTALGSLTNGTSYTFTVRALNASGSGPESAPSNAVVPTAPATTGTGSGGTSTPTTTAPPPPPPPPPAPVPAPAPVNRVWAARADGGVVSYADAPFLGSVAGVPLSQPVVGMAATPTGNGYWLVASDGGIFAFGDAAFHGSTGAVKLNNPVVGMAATPSGRGYWLVASDGGIFAFGDAAFHGSTGAVALNKPVVGMAATPSGHGYWLVASDGGIFAFGDAPFHGSTGAVALSQPITGMAPTASGGGYRFVARDGGVFTFGDAPFFGSGVGLGSHTTAGMAGGDGGYWLVDDGGAVRGFGGVPTLPATVSTGGASVVAVASP